MGTTENFGDLVNVLADSKHGHEGKIVIQRQLAEFLRRNFPCARKLSQFVVSLAGVKGDTIFDILRLVSEIEDEEERKIEDEVETKLKGVERVSQTDEFPVLEGKNVSDKFLEYIQFPEETRENVIGSFYSSL